MAPERLGNLHAQITSVVSLHRVLYMLVLGLVHVLEFSADNFTFS